MKNFKWLPTLIVNPSPIQRHRYSPSHQKPKRIKIINSLHWSRPNPEIPPYKTTNHTSDLTSNYCTTARKERRRC